MRAHVALRLVFTMWFGIVELAVAVNPSERVDCPDIPVLIIAGSASDRALVCSGARRAVEFLRSTGFGIKQKISVHLRDTLLRSYDAHIGFYDFHTKEIELLVFDQAVTQCANQSPFGVAMDEELYTSFAAHEIAHAIADRFAQLSPVSQVMQEYIAYVTQLATMEPVKRSSILRRYKVAAFSNTDEMSMTYYGLDPNAFAVKAYRHFLTLGEPAQFLAGMLSGTLTHRDSQMKSR